MGMFFYLDEALISLEDPMRHVRPEFKDLFAASHKPYILSELCVIDMLCALTRARGGHYKRRAVVKGGHSVRNYVPLEHHRFSFDVDLNPNSFDGYSYGKISGLKKDLHRYASERGCTTALTVTKENPWYFLQVGYADQLKARGLRAAETSKIDVCKTCRTFERPVLSRMNTMIDLEVLGIEPPEFAHLCLEEQISNKLATIGSSSRQRNHLDAYDAYRMCTSNEVDWKKAKRIFEASVVRRGQRPSEFVGECRRMLDTVKAHPGKRADLGNAAFRPDPDFDAMIDAVKGYYGFGRRG